MKNIKLRTRPLAIKLMLWAAFLYLLAAALSGLNIVDLASLEKSYILLVVGLFLLVDQGIYAKKKINKPKGFINWAIAISAVVLLVGVLLGFIGMSMTGFLGTLQAWVISFLAVILLIALVTD